MVKAIPLFFQVTLVSQVTLSKKPPSGYARVAKPKPGVALSETKMDEND